MMNIRLGLLLLLLPVAARAEPVQASYATYAAGFNVLNLDATFDVTPASYSVRLSYRTAGTFSLVISGGQDATVEGRFVEGRAVPQRFYSAGKMRGQQRVTQIDYPGGQPVVRQLVPTVDEEREPVAADKQANTIDTISAMAQLVRQVNQTGRCEGQVLTFDGRRLSQMTAHSAGRDMLPPSNLSSFTGPALHCDFEGRELAGFMLDQDKASRDRLQRGSAWFAATTPGGPLIPVRIRFETRWFGDATMFLVPKR